MRSCPPLWTLTFCFVALLFAPSAAAIPEPPEPLLVWVDASQTSPPSVFSVLTAAQGAAIGKLGDTASAQTASSDGVHLCTALGSKGRVSALWGDPSKPAEASVVLDEGLHPGDIHAVLVHKNHCYLGASGARTIDIDFGVNPPKVTLFDAPPEVPSSKIKSVDVLLVSGDLMLAVDDIMMPFYVFVFKKDTSGALAYSHTASLGPDINGHYHWGLVQGDAVGLLSSTVHRGGQGQALSWYHRDQFATPLPSGTNPDEHPLKSWSNIGEHAAWDAKSAQGLLAGPAYTRLYAGAILHDRLWLAADTRGVLSAPWDAAKGAGPVVGSSAGGSCLDLIARNGQLWILRDQAGTKQAVLVAWDPATERLTDLKAVDLPATATRFLR